MKEDNQQLKQLTGPSLSKIIRRLDTLENPSTLNPTKEASLNWSSLKWNNTRTAPVASEAKQQPPISLQEIGNKRLNRVEFDPSKCIVIHDIQDPTQAGKDDQIRRIVGRDKDITIERITHSHTGNIMVQLSETTMIQNTISTWNTENFGGSRVRRTKSPNYTHGVLKGVPSDIEESDIVDVLKSQGYNNTSVRRLTRRNKPLRVVKVQFDKSEDLQRAIKNKVTIDHLMIIVEECNSSPFVLQCHNCRRFGHRQSECGNQKICYNCSAEYTDDHKECQLDPKCINCKGNHPSSSRQCPKHIELLNRQIERLNKYKQIQGNHG